MTALALPTPRPAGVASELLQRQRTLTLFGLALLLLAVPTLLLQAADPRLLESGVSVWVKPAKFLVSIGVFALTAAWFFGYVRPERRGSRPMRASVALVIVPGTLELIYIVSQAAQGLESHFNLSSPFYALMYGLMGLFALLLTGTTLPMAWEIVRRPAEGITRDFAAAIGIGLVLTFLLGAGLGGYMSAQSGHSVGSTGGHVPVFGWNRSGGDLRAAHFLGIHAEQAMLAIALLVARLPERRRWLATVSGAVAYTGLTLAVFAQAVAGRPLLPL
jgi:hypothetical protein